MISACAIALLVASQARAGSIEIVKGGPTSPNGKRELVRQLVRVGPKLSRCFGNSKRTVEVALAFARSGRIRATARTRGSIARCVASVLSRHQVSHQVGSTPVVIRVVPSTGKARRRDMSNLRNELAGLRDQVDRCARRHRTTGVVQLVFVIMASGELDQPRVASARGVSGAAQACMVKAARLHRVGAQPDTLAARYRLSLSFDHRGGTTPAQPRSRPGPQPQKFGPRAAAEIARVMNARQRAFERCYTRYARTTRLTGEVVIRFTIRPNGTVRNVKVRKTTLRHKGVEACLVSTGKTLRFSAMSGTETTRVFYPFRFGR